MGYAIRRQNFYIEINTKNLRSFITVKACCSMTHTTAKIIWFLLVIRYGSSSEYCYTVWYGKKTRIVYLPDGEKIFSGYVEPLRQTTCVRQTDRETDGQTSYGSIVRAVHSIAR